MEPRAPAPEALAGSGRCPGLFLTRLSLTNFRSYPHLAWRPATNLSVITGPNGSGKTNLLEAVSLLAPGRGLRGAKLADLARRGAGPPGAWGVNARLWRAGTEREIGTGSPLDAPQGRRVFRLDGTAPRSQAEVAGACPCVWLTPQMDRLFQERRVGAAAVPRPPGLGIGAGPCARGFGLRGGDGRAQPPLGPRRARPGLARRLGG